MNRYTPTLTLPRLAGEGTKNRYPPKKPPTTSSSVPSPASRGREQKIDTLPRSPQLRVPLSPPPPRGGGQGGGVSKKKTLNTNKETNHTTQLLNTEIYTFLCLLFAVLIILGNLTYQKFVTLPFYLHPTTLSVGALLYPLTFFITDLISEFFGREKARFCVAAALLMNFLTAAILVGMDALPATSWSRLDNTTFHQVFGSYRLAFAGSMLACYTAQILDVTVYLWIKKRTQSRWLWLRSNSSTALALWVDTFLVVGFMAFFGLLPWEHFFTLVINSYLYKLLFTVCSTPFFYLCVRIIRAKIQT